MIFIYSYIVGNVISINKKTITIENNGFGYYVYVAKPESFTPNIREKIYLHRRAYLGNKTTIQEDLYGFKRYEEKQFFIKLLTIPGIGPKTAIQICETDPKIIQELVSSGDCNGLCSLKGITPKLAKQLIEELQTEEHHIDQSMSSDLIGALKSLGYNDKEISLAITRLNQQNSSDLSDLISESIKIIARGSSFEHIKA